MVCTMSSEDANDVVTRENNIFIFISMKYNHFQTSISSFCSFVAWSNQEKY